jgi:hypothetical protein
MSNSARTLDRATVLSRFKEAAAALGRVPTRPEFRAASGISRKQVVRLFGCHRELLRAAGHEPYGAAKRLPTAVILRNLRDGFIAAGGIVLPAHFRRVCRLDLRTIQRRWGGWDKALAALRDWLERDEPDYPHLPALRRLCRGIKAPQPKSSLAPRCGELLRFRALDHLVAEELGFVLETIGAQFPDAIGRRRIGKAWQHVRIEFEYESRSFRTHRHDPKSCDLIVCWEDNWPECPVEVLELKREIKRLMNRKTVTPDKPRVARGVPSCRRTNGPRLSPE